MVEVAAAERRLAESVVELVVTIILNGETKGDFFLVQGTDGLLIKREDADALGLKIPSDRNVLLQGQPYVPVSLVQEIGSSFDEKTLTLTMKGKTLATGKTVIDFTPAGAGKRNVYQTRETSAFLNYGLSSSYLDPGGFSSFTATGKLGLRTGDLFFISDAEYTKTDSDETFTRLMSNLTYERPADLQRLVLGDQFASSGSLGSTMNIGGVGFSKVYTMDPYLITRPLFNLRGATEFPSQAEVYLDGRRIGEQHIQAGEFELKNISSYGGAHTVEVLYRDPFGNERRVLYPAYFSDALLQQGLHEYSYHIGFLREGYGEESNDYGKPAFSAFHRYGLSNNLNLRLRAEGTEDVSNGGIQVSSLIPRIGHLMVDLAGSSGDDGDGWAASLLHTYQNKRFGLNISFRGNSRDYAAVGTVSDENSIKHEASAGAGYSFADWGGLSMGWSELERYSGTATRTLWATYSKDLTPQSTLILTTRAVKETDTDFQVSIGYTWRPRRDTHLSMNFNRTGSSDVESVQLHKNLPTGEGLGYRAFVQRQATETTERYSFNPSLQYNARYGTFLVSPRLYSNGETTAEGYVTAAGSLVYAGGFFGLSRPVGDSFGLVLADNLSGARVLVNNVAAGSTAANGRMVIPNLAAYYENEVALDSGSFPMDLSVTEMKMKILPALWSGSCIAFDVAPLRAVTGTLVVRQGDKKMPVEYQEITLKVGEREVKASLAKGGEFYLENILPQKTASGGWDPKSCRGIAARMAAGSPVIKPGTYRGRVGVGEEGGCGFELSFPDTEDVISDVGEIVCTLPQTYGPAPKGAAPDVVSADVPRQAPAAEEDVAALVPAIPSFEESLPEAFAALFRLWKLEALADEVRLWSIFNFQEKLLPVYFEETGLSRSYHMVFVTRPATLASLRALNLPCLAREEGGSQGSRWVVLSELQGDKAVLLEPGGGRSEIPAEVWVAKVRGSLIFLLPQEAVPASLHPGERGPAVIALQRELKRTGFFRDLPNAVYGRSTSEAVTALQDRFGVDRDGIAGRDLRLRLLRLDGRTVPLLREDL